MDRCLLVNISSHQILTFLRGFLLLPNWLHPTIRLNTAPLMQNHLHKVSLNLMASLHPLWCKTSPNLLDSPHPLSCKINLNLMGKPQHLSNHSQCKDPNQVGNLQLPSSLEPWKLQQMASLLQHSNNSQYNPLPNQLQLISLLSCSPIYSNSKLSNRNRNRNRLRHPTSPYPNSPNDPKNSGNPQNCSTLNRPNSLK